MNGTGTNSIGTMLYAEANSSDVTEDTMAKWYFGYVKDKDYNWAVIKYKDKTDEGVVATSGIIEKDVKLVDNGDGTYSMGDETSDTTYYYASDSGETLVKSK